MDDKIELAAFPKNRLEALALLYVQNQDLKGKSPSEIQTMYFEAYYELQHDYSEKSHSGFFKGLK